ncbi:MAG: hypothetical protein U1F42_08745 [Candidatus Competibacteraceae bacterium]
MEKNELPRSLLRRIGAITKAIAELLDIVADHVLIAMLAHSYTKALRSKLRETGPEEIKKVVFKTVSEL